ncbi:G protein-coupled receptor [Caenorhabditis elegans]|uniref:G protein-coupled receptor n=1 Tax=Caenorhabditis elegans TaxID=6239 RepID=A0A2I2LDW8_CAEEL|nr:G protein-coupled receptor [Caenorhabditis elegans]SOT38359.1 G protein-coupled receptor [Caenorhabditis elegans]|eukprot:NP_001346731.1 Uncharacterized protein CELE_ZC190.5 [Caenorhabditis elegans]
MPSIIWSTLTVFESILVFHSFTCSLFLLYLIWNAKRLHPYCRVYLLMVGLSMTLFASYGFSIFEYLNSSKYYALTPEFATLRSKTWEFIHEFGVCLQSLSMLLFSMERYSAIRYPDFHASTTFVVLIYVSIVSAVFLALSFSVGVHIYGQLILATSLMSLSDYLGLIILIFAWRSSIRNYRLSTGKASLKRRYQMSEVYAWTSTLLPAVAGASIFKVLSMIPIWIWLLSNLTDWEYGLANFLYNNILNAYVCLFPWVLISRNRSLKKQILAKKRISPDGDTMKSVRTLEGKHISMRPSQAEYFDALKDSWK